MTVARVVYISWHMKNTLFALVFIMLSLPVFASDWAVRWDHANIRKGPSIKGILVYSLRRTQCAKISNIDEKGSWIKVRFGAYISLKAYKSLRLKGVEVKRLGSEGNMVQVNISGWTKKENLREK